MRGPPQRIQHNRDHILENYSRGAYSARLAAVYRRAAGRRVQHQIDKSRLINAFMQFDNFSLLKWNPYRDAL